MTEHEKNPATVLHTANNSFLHSPIAQFVQRSPENGLKVQSTPASRQQCKVTAPRVLFFIRMPKCASTSFVNLLQSLSKSQSFTLLFNPSGAYDWDKSTIRAEARQVMSKRGKVVYARHFYYVDFQPYGVKNFTYVTVIREPVARFVSSYLYYHFSTRPHIQSMLKPEHRHESILECTSRKHNGCAHNWLTKYFCGHQKHCAAGDSQALVTAKQNMHKFAAVGVLEEMSLTLKVFGMVLPEYFSSTAPQIEALNRNERSMVLSAEEQEAIQRANAADIELYAHARDLLHTTANSCKI